MSKVIGQTTNMDFSGSRAGKDVTVYILDGEPTREQASEYHAQGIGFQFASGPFAGGEWMVGSEPMFKGTKVHKEEAGPLFWLAVGYPAVIFVATMLTYLVWLGR